MAITGLAACALLIGVLAPSQSVSAVDITPPVTFPGWPDPPWPPYAQERISVFPEPPVPGQPTEICAEVVNHDSEEPKPAVLEFGVGPLGIGVQYEPIGFTQVEVPPEGNATGCIWWVPPEVGHRSIQVILEQRVRKLVSRQELPVYAYFLYLSHQPLTISQITA